MLQLTATLTDYVNCIWKTVTVWLHGTRSHVVWTVLEFPDPPRPVCTSQLGQHFQDHHFMAIWIMCLFGWFFGENPQAAAYPHSLYVGVVDLPTTHRGAV